MECGLLPDMLTEHHTHVIFTIMSPSVLPCIELQVDCVSVYAAQNTCMYVCMYVCAYIHAYTGDFVTSYLPYLFV